MISLNVIGMECLRVVGVAFSRSYGGGRSFVFTYKNGVHKPPILASDTCFISTRVISTTASTGRLKREDCTQIKSDSAFSEWKMLVRPSGWRDHSIGKEGAEKYATQNLPNCTSPGIYELAVLIPGKQPRKLNRNTIIPVYLGQADNVRVRVQKYGRDGAHLENGSPNGPYLFSQIFCRHSSIVYRWARMENKKEAERTEKELLAEYDYAWNKTGNGDRRPDDIHRKLESCPKQSFLFVVCMMLQKQLRDRIKSFFKTWRMQVSGHVHQSGSICGVAIGGDGSVCSKPPVKGRKRCIEHKGMKSNSAVSKFIKAPNVACKWNSCLKK